jgi:beta-glucosidase
MVDKRLAAFALIASIALSSIGSAQANDTPRRTEQLLDTFSWAGGIEDTFIPQAKPGMRKLEEYELTQHYDQWKQDLDRAKSLGLTKLRWGVPWYKVEAKSGEYDWSFTDKVINYMVDDLHIDPIIDLVHYGTPTWMPEGFLDPTYPERVAKYARAFAQRYKDKVAYYTPTNEPAVTAEFCGLKGEWPPYLNGDTGYVKVLLPVVRGIQEISKVVREVDPDASLVAVEAMRYVAPADDESKQAAETEFQRDMLPWDLASGKVDDEHPLYEWLKKNGADEALLKQLRDNGVHQDVFGVNFYPWSIKTAKQDGSKVVLKDAPQRGRLLRKVLANAYRHTKVPLFVTETSATGDQTARSLWMSETIDAVRMARSEGVPVVGYTWFPLITMIDWQYRTEKKPLEAYLLHLGLWDSAFDDDGVLQRKETSLVDNYRDWITVGMSVKK